MIWCNILMAALLIAPAVPLTAQSLGIPEAQSFQAREAGKGDSDYQQGLSALDARNWEQAIGFFNESASHKGGNADAALYWLAYAQNRAGERGEALATIKQLRQAYASSRWMNDARALEVEIRAQNGTPVSPSAEPDEDLKLLALNSLMASDPDKALPILRKLLTSNNSGKIKDRALFVLVQNPSPEARKIVSDMARNTSNPDLQLKAIRYMGMMGGEDSRKDLASIYTASSDERVKTAILKSFMISGSRGLLLSVAKSEKNPELRREAIRQLALCGGKDELWQLFQQETSIDNKKEILKSMFLSGDSAKLADLARSLKEPELKIAAIKSLGLMGGNGHGDVLVSIYQSDPDTQVRLAVLNALFLQQNGKALVDLARAEKDPQMKEEIVKKMSLVHSKEVTDYMMEILK
ncbi:MAG TPA: HEAT repeat domain-containing protein [Bryobacteraceae bacterium]|jgi:HEAT repeat protein|nr:HEAT repeat domain-containing protein [Bryobacteraceae bacterium]